MLKKLIKYEWKSVSKIASIMLIAILAVTVLGCVMLQMPWIKDLFAEENNLGEVQMVILIFLMVISLILYIFMLVGIIYGIMIYLGVHFYKTMYTDQGYLIHTLPVTPNQILISKIFVSGVWYVLIELGVVLSVVALAFSFGGGVIGVSEGYNAMESMAMLWEEMLIALESEFGPAMVHFAVIMILIMLISPFTGMIMLFGSITLGQLSGKHKALMGILAYFGVCMVNMIISSIVQMVYTIKLSVDSIQDSMAVSEMEVMGIYDYTLIIGIGMAALLYWISHQILTKKLNMD